MESKVVTDEGIDAAGEAHANGTPGAGVPEATTGADWQQAHNELVRLAHTRAGLDCEEGHWLLVALRSGAHRRLGFASFLEYLERLFGYSPPVCSGTPSRGRSARSASGPEAGAGGGRAQLVGRS